MKPSLIIIKQIAGYLLFLIAIVYALSKTPSEIWNLNPLWVIPAILLTLISLFIQVLQLKIFIDFHKKSIDWKWAILFTVRKAILNTFLPAKSGTLVLLHTLTEKYNVSWKDYVHFMIFSSLVTLFISFIFSLLFFIRIELIFIVIIFIFLISIIFSKKYSFSYIMCLPSIFLYAFILYFIFLGILWCILISLGYNITFIDASLFAIAVNALSQISVTPGNLGVRETLLGALAPYIALPVSVGILAGAILFAFRIIASAVLLAILEGKLHFGRTNPDAN
ncbi:MAG: hypothetical protein GWO08_21740 [Gammaproteobacteria bacterium]|nr:hypothetical protein [Gammaproteobacteria bacterium]NIN62891.1 hypothetical protein [Gammaproteobacteria bacterium]NIO63872.1 hypothetical protein [Gammaproteobacteria bacterium]NIP50249.1 hypothetical protein [Gammaproteobacteria bacterium]NIQ12468.1 hypothetical protein [Gammaproteobacteria bacterium]